MFNYNEKTYGNHLINDSHDNFTTRVSSLCVNIQSRKKKKCERDNTMLQLHATIVIPSSN